MQLHIKLSPQTDRALILALQAVPAGQRAARIRAALRQAFVEAPELAHAIHRLADVLEQRHGAAPPTRPASVPPSPTAGPAGDGMSPEGRAGFLKGLRDFGVQVDA